MSKNCHTCKHLQYETGDEYGVGRGWYCEKREPKTIEQETKMDSDMARKAYRNRYKRCYEPSKGQP